MLPVVFSEGLFFPCDVAHSGGARLGGRGQLGLKDWLLFLFAVPHFNTFSVVASCQQ